MKAVVLLKKRKATNKTKVMWIDLLKNRKHDKFAVEIYFFFKNVNYYSLSYSKNLLNIYFWKRIFFLYINVTANNLLCKLNIDYLPSLLCLVV